MHEIEPTIDAFEAEFEGAGSLRVAVRGGSHD